MRLQKYIKESTITSHGMSKAKLKSTIYKMIGDATKKIYSDQYWNGVKKIWDVLDALELDWYIHKTEYKTYNKENKMPDAKEWRFQMKWFDNKGKSQTIGGIVTAHGAGSVEDPLDRYDVTIVF